MGSTPPSPIYDDGVRHRFKRPAPLRFELVADPGSPAEGDLWNDITQKAIAAYTGGLKRFLDGTIFLQTADATISNNASETSLFGTGIGTRTLPANFLVPGRVVVVDAWGIYSTSSSPGTLDIILRLGGVSGTLLCNTGAGTLAVSMAGRPWHVRAVIICRTAGASGTVMAQANWEHIEAASDRAGVTWWSMETPSNNAVVIDTTASQVVELSADFQTASTSNTITTKGATVSVAG